MNNPPVVSKASEILAKLTAKYDIYHKKPGPQINPGDLQITFEDLMKGGEPSYSIDNKVNVTSKVSQGIYPNKKSSQDVFIYFVRRQ